MFGNTVVYCEMYQYGLQRAGFPDNEVHQGIEMPGMPYFTRVPGCAGRLRFTPLRRIVQETIHGEFVDRLDSRVKTGKFKQIQDPLERANISTAQNIYADVTRELKIAEFEGLDI